MVMNIHIRSAKKDHIPWMVKCGNATRQLWSSESSKWYEENDILQLLTKWADDIIILVAELDSKPVGFILVQSLHVWAICFGLYVISEFRSRGVGHQLIKRAEEQLLKMNIHSLHLLVEIDNPRALAFYKKEGFEQGYEFHWMNKTLK